MAFANDEIAAPPFRGLAMTGGGSGSVDELRDNPVKPLKILIPLQRFSYGRWIVLPFHGTPFFPIETEMAFPIIPIQTAAPSGKKSISEKARP